MKKFFKILSSLLIFSAATFAATLEDAQKAYVSGNWKTAAESFEAVCPTLDISKRSECALWGVLSRSQIGNSKDFSIAKKRLDSLIIATPDSLPVIADLYMTRAQFELYLKRADLSQKSLRTAANKAKPNQLAVIHQVCQSLYKANPTDSVHSLCAEIERKKSGIGESAPTSTASSSAATAVLASDSLSSSTVTISSSSISAVAISSAADSVKPANSTATTVSAPAAIPAPTASGEVWALQLGAFSILANAEMLVNSLKAKKIDAQIIEFQTDEKTLFQVQTGRFPSRDAAVEYGSKTLSSHNLEFQPVKKQ